MHKKNLIYYCLILLLLIIAYLLIDNNRTSLKDDTNFAIEDTSSINKIFLADRMGNSILLERKKFFWMLNDKYIVKKTAINILLNTIKDIRVKRPVPLSSLNYVIKEMSATGTKIEIYGEKSKFFNLKKDMNALLKIYTLGHPSSDYLGNYMLLQGKKNPYIVHIPGFNGFLSPRYGIQVKNLDVNCWRSTEIFSLKKEEIDNINIKNYSDSSQSFTLLPPKLKLFNHSGKLIEGDKEKMIKFINYFSNLHCESYQLLDEKIDDSLILYDLIINQDTLKIYQMNNTLITKKEHNFNVKRMYGVLNNTDMMLIQNHVFNKVLINIEEFIN